MITVTIYQNRDRITGFRCFGHSGYAESGSDIVCAGASALVINTINSLEEITRERMEVSADDAAGIIRCFFVDQPLKNTSKVLMDSLVLGLTQIEKQYGKKHCKLTFEEV